MERATIAARYALSERLSAGAMSEVWTANDATLDRVVVVKLLAETADRRRFEREARAAAALTHPNIVQLFDYGEHGDRPYIVFEHLPGGSLASRLASDQLTGDEVVRLAADVASGLAYAHRHGVVHRDLKPGNILFDAGGSAKIADFGIALVAGADTLTRGDEILGTPAYMAPEQARGEPATPATDVYSFGVILYELLSGRLPFVSANPVEVAAMHRDADVPPLTSVRRDVPPPFAALTMTTLAKDAATRPADGTALLAAVREAAGAETSGVAATLPTTGDATVALLRPGRPRRRSRPALVAAVLAAVLLLAGVVAAVSITRKSDSTPPVPSAVLKTRRTLSRASSTRGSEVASHSPSTRPATTQRVLPVAAHRAGTRTASSPAASEPTTAVAPPTDTTPAATTASTATATATPTDAATTSTAP